MRDAIDQYEGGLEAFSRGYEKLGFTRRYIDPLNDSMKWVYLLLELCSFCCEKTSLFCCMSDPE